MGKIEFLARLDKPNQIVIFWDMFSIKITPNLENREIYRLQRASIYPLLASWLEVTGAG